MTEDEFAAYQSLAEETEDHRWAFGTGFTDPLEGIDTSVPDGTDRHRSGQQAVAFEGDQHLGQPVGQFGPDEPAANTQGHVVSLVAEALDELDPSAEESFQVHLYHRLLLTLKSRL